MDENILRAVVGRDEPEALLVAKPLHSACWHGAAPYHPPQAVASKASGGLGGPARRGASVRSARRGGPARRDRKPAEEPGAKARAGGELAAQGPPLRGSRRP